jgi:hypothetical protein
MTITNDVNNISVEKGLAGGFFTPYLSIPTIAVSFPADAVCGETRRLRFFFRKNNIGKYFRYGNTAIIMIATNHFDGMIPVWEQVLQHFRMLQEKGVLSENLGPEQLKIHEIKLKLEFSISGLFFCKTEGFRQINGTTYKSTDYRKYIRECGEFRESKGIQASFLTVEQHKSHCALIFTFSGRYREHITPEFLNTSIEFVILRLLRLVSIYLTQVTSPEYFEIFESYLPFLPESFKSVFANAGWFNDGYKKKYMTKNFIGGLYNEI